MSGKRKEKETLNREQSRTAYLLCKHSNVCTKVMNVSLIWEHLVAQQKLQLRRRLCCHRHRRRRQNKRLHR